MLFSWIIHTDRYLSSGPVFLVFQMTLHQRCLRRLIWSCSRSSHFSSHFFNLNFLRKRSNLQPFLNGFTAIFFPLIFMSFYCRSNSKDRRLSQNCSFPCPLNSPWYGVEALKPRDWKIGVTHHFKCINIHFHFQNITNRNETVLTNMKLLINFWSNLRGLLIHPCWNLTIPVWFALVKKDIRFWESRNEIKSDTVRDLLLRVWWLIEVLLWASNDLGV